MNYKVKVEIAGDLQELAINGKDKSEVIENIWKYFGASVIIKSIEEA